jgi:hypothetical protein
MHALQPTQDLVAHIKLMSMDVSVASMYALPVP